MGARRREIFHGIRKMGVIGTLLSCFFLICLGTASNAEDVVKIGVVFPLSGPVAEAASWAVEGIKMAGEEINAKGGIAVQGKHLKMDLIIYDSKCDPSTGVAAVEKMISRDRVIAISGDYCSSCCLAEREVSGRNKIVQVTPLAVNPKITSLEYPYMFRLVNTVDMYAKPYVDFISKKTSIKTVALLAVTDDWGRSAVEIYGKLYSQKGIKISTVEYFKHGDTDFYSQITKIIATKPDAVYIVTSENSQNIGTLKQLKELGYKGQLLGCSGYIYDDMLRLGGKQLLEGMYVEAQSYEWTKDENPAVKQWIQRYNKRFGRYPSVYSLYGYNSIDLLADVVKRANTLVDKEKIRESMTKANLNSLTGFNGEPYFDEKGQAHPFLGVIQYRDGKRIPVYKQEK
jgi:branched-chain amino acid transport system substrate-binding protein